MYRCIFLLLSLTLFSFADECDPPTVIRPVVSTEIHGFRGLVVDQTVSNGDAINFGGGPSLVAGGMTLSGGTGLTVPKAGNYLIMFSVVQAATASNFCIFINGVRLPGGTMDNGFDLVAMLGVPYMISRIATLAAGDTVDIRNITPGDLSELLTATDSATTASTRAIFTVVALS